MSEARRRKTPETVPTVDTTGGRPEPKLRNRPTNPLKVVLALVVLNFVLSFYITGSATWDYKTKWTNPRYLQFRYDHLKNHELPVFTEDELAKFNGESPGQPIYLAINGKVYDVTSNPLTYGPGGPYSMFSGRDAARAFHTGCFQSDLTHDLRGLPEVEALEDVVGWQQFFENSHKYWHIGYVSHGPLKGDPPAPCENGFKLPKGASKQVGQGNGNGNGKIGKRPIAHLPHNVQHPHPYTSTSE